MSQEVMQSVEGEDGVAEAAEETSGEGSSKRKNLWLRLGVLLLLVVGLYGLAHVTGLTRLQSFGALQQEVEAAGAFGWFVFAGIFILLHQMHIPGIFFLLAAMWLFGPWEGALVGGIAAQISLMIHYVVIRGVGGTPLGESERPWVKKWVERLHRYPLRAMIVIRLVMVMSPTVNIPVILSGIGFRDYALGTAIGMGAFLVVIAGGFDLFEPWVRGVLGL